MNRNHKLTILILSCAISSHLQPNPDRTVLMRRKMANQNLTVTGQQLSNLFVTTPQQIAGEVERTMLDESVSPKSRKAILAAVSTTGSESFSFKEENEIIGGQRTRKLRRALTSLMPDYKSRALLLTTILSPMSPTERSKALATLLNTTSGIKRGILANRLATQ